MEEMMYFFVVVACAMFVIKTVVSWIQTAKYQTERKVREAAREAEYKARKSAFGEARLDALEKFQSKLEKEIEETR